jgi:hypothetical protein
MPKPLSHEQVESLQASGVVVPGLEVPATDPDSNIPAGLLLRTLGSVGLPHSEIIGRIEADPDDSATSVSLPETPNSPDLLPSYMASHDTVSKIMGLIGDAVPSPRDPNLVAQLNTVIPMFEVLTSQGLQPEISLSPVNRPLSFWMDLAKATEDSSLNPDEPDPDNQGQTRRVLRNGGLWVADDAKKSWDTLTDPSQPSWRVEVISSLDRPSIVNITSYGYTDEKNQAPSPELNQLLTSLGKPVVTDRSGRGSNKQPLTQPDIHPGIENYTMHQLSRIIRGQSPLDASTWSWLKGTLASGALPSGSFNPDGGRVSLRWVRAGLRAGALGVRPSGRGRP